MSAEGGGAGAGEPRRLIDDPSTDPALREAMQRAAQHAPPFDPSAGLARLEGAIGGAGGAIGAGTIAAGVAAVGIAIALAAVWAGRSAEPAERSEATSTPASERAPLDREATIEPGGTALPEETIAEDRAAPAGAARAESATAEARERAPARETASRLAAAEHGARTTEDVARSDADGDEGALAREMAQLAEARRALGREPARALALLDEGRRLYPRTLFAEERSALRVLALAELHRDAEARLEGERFLAAHPRSPHAERVRRAIAGGQAAPPP